jgi:hypothetical protein
MQFRRRVGGAHPIPAALSHGRKPVHLNLFELLKKDRGSVAAAKRGELFDGEEVLPEILGESRKRQEASAK